MKHWPSILTAATAVVSSLVLVGLGGCASAPLRPAQIALHDEQATQTYLSALIRHTMNQADVPGLSIALVDDQSVVWAQGFGEADVAQHTPASADTIYRVGSISKLFTDTAAMQLVEQGKLSLDAPVRTYLPAFAPKTLSPQASISLRQLMTHHSGLPRDELKGFFNPEPRPFAELAAQASQEYTAYAPDQLFHYSNLGISLLGDVVQTVSGEAFAAHMQRTLLAPLGMAGASFRTGSTPSPLMAKGYGLKKAPDPNWPLRDVPAGGLNASANDLARFVSMVFADGMVQGQRVLQPGTLRQMLTPQNTGVPLDLGAGIGLGWLLHSGLGQPGIAGERMAQHGGAIGGFRSQMLLLPERKLGVVVLANSVAAQDLVNRIAAEALSLALEAKTGRHTPPADAAPVPAWADDLDEASAQAWVGDYSTVIGLLRVQRDGRRLQAHNGNTRLDLRPRTDGQMGLQYRLLGLLPMPAGNLAQIGLSLRQVAGREVLVAQQGDRQMLAGQRISPPATLGAWQQRLGDYAITDLGGDPAQVDHVSLQQIQGYLMLEVRAKNVSDSFRRVLMPVTDTEARVVGLLHDGGEVVSVVQRDGQEQLHYSGYAARKVSGR